MSNKSKRAEGKTRDNASRNEPASAQHRAGDARTSEQAREQGTKEPKPRTTPRKRRPPFVL